MFLVTGAYGQLGNELRLLLGEKALYVDRDVLDITDEKAVKDFFSHHDVDLVINCAGYTAVDKAEDEPDLADSINRLGPALLARYGRRIIHISTDYVFDGTGHRPYSEESVPHPVSVYGVSKLAGERAVLAEAETAFVFRTAWLYSRFGNNFVKTMRKLGASRDSVGVVSDQIGTPTYAADLAGAINLVIGKMRAGEKDIYHYTDEGVASWYDFAVAVMEFSGLSCFVRPLSTEEYPVKAVRPAYSVLSKAKFRRDFGVNIPHWREALLRCIQSLEQKN